MTKILSINGHGDEKGNSLFDSFKDWFSSQDKFVKNTFIIFLLLAIATPFIVANRFSLSQHAAPNGGVAFVSATNTAITTTATPDVYLQLAYPDSWSLTDAQQPEFVKKAYAQSCSGYVVQNNAAACNQPAYDTCGSTYCKDGLRYVDCHASQAPDACIGTLRCGSEDYKCQPTPTATPQPTVTIVPTAVPTATSAISPSPSMVSPSATPGVSPTVVPAHPVLFKITIQNADTTGAETRILTITGPQNIANALNSPVFWRLNPLAKNETSAQRNVEVTYFAHAANGDTQVPVTANITLITPVLSPTPTPTGVLSPTPTPLGTYTTPTASPEHPTPTGANTLPTPTTAPGMPTATPTVAVLPSPTGRQQAPTATPTQSASPTVTETPAPVTGDVDGNGCLDTNDFNIWAQAFQTQTVRSGTNPDIDHNGRIDINDASIWYQAMQKGDHTCR